MQKITRNTLTTLVILSTFISNTYAQFAGGAGTVSDPYRIATLNQLQEVKNHVTSSFVLLNDIDASETSAWNSGSGFEPIGNSSAFFTGNFNGAGYKITGLTINRPSLNSVGLFGLQYSGVVSNLILENVNITGKERVGALIGNKNGDAVNCKSSGTVTGTRNVGGLTGSNLGKITNCSSSCTVTGTSDVGGLVGSGAGTGILDSFATGNVNGGVTAGGFIGGISSSGGTIENSYATGNVTATVATTSVGGFAGRMQAGKISYCYATGNVSGGNTSGGFIGHNQSTIEKCYSTGSVTIGAGGVVGGFAGSNERGNISNSYSTSNVVKNSPANSTGYAGGFIGRNQYASTITNTYAAGTLTVDGGPVGAFAGTNEIQNTDSGKIINSYWDTDVNTQAVAIPNNQVNAVNTQVSGLSATQIRQLASFPGWDFASVWMIEEGVTRPLLRTTALSTSLQNPRSELRNKLKVYYIRGSQTIHIDDTEVENGAQLRVISAEGRVAMIQSISQSEVDVSALNAGVYIIELNTGRGIVKTARIMII